MQSFHCPITIAFHVLHWYVRRLAPLCAGKYKKFTQNCLKGSPSFISEIFFTDTVLVKTFITLQNISLYNLIVTHSHVIKNLIHV